MLKSMTKLKKSIRNHWRKVDVDFLAPYFESMPNRMKMTIENEESLLRILGKMA